MNFNVLWPRLARVAAVWAGLWLGLVGLSQWVRLVPGWPLWIIAGGLAIAAEWFIGMYRYESRTLGRRRSRWLIGLRLAALGVLAWMVLEPTFVRTVSRQHDRQVAVLWDLSASMDLIDEGAKQSRLEIARAAVAESGILKQLGEHVRLRELPFARSPDSESHATADGWNQATDIAAALDSVLDQVPPDELAGAIVLTDGRHNRPALVGESARRFGVLDAPLGIVAIGSPSPPRDAAVLAVRSPDAIHLGDRMRVTADLKFDGFQGQQAMARLTCDGVRVAEKAITIPADRHREEVKFLHLPAQGGIGVYQVEIDPMPGERFRDNNGWSFETSITEARTNVLLVDAWPRWEFRYLRNLFYGRDKSIHLQWMLLHPDQAEGQTPVDVAASAARPIGQAAASRLPENEAEWRKFDVIILGDLPPDAISAGTWQIISRCVNERGALLVFSAGPNHMPHALDDPAARELLPLDPGWSHRTLFGTTEAPFRFALTAEGRHHPATAHASGNLANEQVWANFPTLPWRHPVVSVKEGAEVLLAANTEDDSRATTANAAGLDAALDGLARRREIEARNALLVTRQTGHGKVAAILTDRTWRLREGAGDVHHHRFWGNLVRWGAGPLLRAGSANVAMGTDQLTYTGDDSIAITARLRDADLSPVPDPTLQAELLLDGKLIATVPLASVEGSNGLHEGKATPLKTPGVYQVRLIGKQADSLLSADGKNSLTTNLRVVASRGPVELAETTLDRPLLDEMATAAGGKVVAPAEVASLLPLFLTEAGSREEIRETPLWDNAIVFAVLALLLTSEWWLRRKSGLP